MKKNCTIRFIVIFPLLWWSGTKPAIYPRYACSLFLSSSWPNHTSSVRSSLMAETKPTGQLEKKKVQNFASVLANPDLKQMV